MRVPKLAAIVATDNNARLRQATLAGKAVDNIMFSSLRFLHTLQLTSFVAPDDKLGSDHRSVRAVFRA